LFHTPLLVHTLPVTQVVVDEAHHTVANSYRAVLEGLGFIEEVPGPDAAYSADASPSSSGSTSPGSSVEDAGSSSDADEGADAASKTVAHYRVLPTPNQLLLGLTATPYRMKAGGCLRCAFAGVGGLRCCCTADAGITP
jgi:hypothetical protein